MARRRLRRQGSRLGQSRERALRQNPRSRPTLRPARGHRPQSPRIPRPPPIPRPPRKPRLQHLAGRRPRPRHLPPHHPRRLPHPQSNLAHSHRLRRSRQSRQAELGPARPPLPLSRRPLCLVTLSAGGEDADTQREFDLKTGDFVPTASPSLAPNRTSPGWTKTPFS